MASRGTFIIGTHADGAGASLLIRAVDVVRPPGPPMRLNAAALREGLCKATLVATISRARLDLLSQAPVAILHTDRDVATANNKLLAAARKRLPQGCLANGA